MGVKHFAGQLIMIDTVAAIPEVITPYWTTGSVLSPVADNDAVDDAVDAFAVLLYRL